MKLRFKVDQAEAFRRGIDAPKSIVTIEVKPSELTQDQRTRIADRLDGIDVCLLATPFGWDSEKCKNVSNHIIADEPTLEALMKAIMADTEPKAKSP